MRLRSSSSSSSSRDKSIWWSAASADTHVAPPRPVGCAIWRARAWSPILVLSAAVHRAPIHWTAQGHPPPPTTRCSLLLLLHLFLTHQPPPCTQSRSAAT